MNVVGVYNTNNKKSLCKIHARINPVLLLKASPV